MDQYQIELPKNGKATILHKRMGFRKPLKFLFFKIRNKERLIAYTATLQTGQQQETVELFKSSKNGKWLEGLSKNGNSAISENGLTLLLKQEIDRYESRLGDKAYMELF
ncbi:MAG: hypothetical protein KIT80_08735 [Chitinophagaceae bacterium]|nr:hypothetical protein [Chitinophagaceae bacterium]MCW5926982.1 hypothetical protein [Chitinophagaceae bacterium]